MSNQRDFTKGEIFKPLLLFMIPLFFTKFLQALFGAGDMLIIGLFSTTNDISAVSTGTQMIDTIQYAIISFAVAITVLVGQQVGRQDSKNAGQVVGTGLWFFGLFALCLTVIFFFPAPLWARLLKTPAESFDKTVLYIRIGSLGAVFIALYNVLINVLRALGDSKTPLIITSSTFVLNFAADYVLIGHFHLGAGGSALTNVLAQALSLVIAVVLIRRQKLPFAFRLDMIRYDKCWLKEIIRVGVPLAVQDLLVSVSFLAVYAIVNSLGVIASAGAGVGERVTAFIMLIPSSFSQALATFTAQNIGAGNVERAQRGVVYAQLTSLAVGIVVFYAAFFHGDLMAKVFVNGKPDVVAAAWSYLRAYAVDCMLTAFLFCFHGFFVGCGLTRFVLVESLVGAFCVRIPVSYLMSKIEPVSLFKVTLATPCSTVVQILICLCYFAYCKKRHVFEQCSVDPAALDIS